jgi:hypothetical protein
MRLVALALIGSRPLKIRIGSDTAEPDDATVLRKPQARPASRASTGVISATSKPVMWVWVGVVIGAGETCDPWLRRGRDLPCVNIKGRRLIGSGVNPLLRVGNRLGHAVLPAVRSPVLPPQGVSFRR